jgi:hypothetical protein
MKYSFFVRPSKTRYLRTLSLSKLGCNGNLIILPTSAKTE